MTLKNLELKRFYESDTDDILNDFYVPALSNSVKYKRLAGFFSSSSLAVAAKGISKFIFKGGHMQLICGAKLRKSDVEAIKEAHKNPTEIIERIMLEDLETLKDEFIQDHVMALGWMIANNIIEIKVAIVIDENEMPVDDVNVEKCGIFHQKVGILEDEDGNLISFSGSDNESATAWTENIEEFKVFRSWIETEKPYLEADIEKFKKFWNGITRRTRVIDIPVAIKERLIEIAPDNIEELKLEKWLTKKIKKRRIIKLWNHQNQAIINWLNNNKKGVFEMATGTGKTFAALGCLKKVMEEEEKLISVIACPYDHLIKQWIDDINEFELPYDNIVIADSSYPGWKDKLADCLLDIKNRIKEKLIVLTTHTTFPTGDFIKIIRMSNEKLLLIVDEVHGIGAEKRKEGLINEYCFRLGLSATPERWFDVEGTEKLFGYFGDTVFEFTLKDAVNRINPSTGKTYLVPYEYKPLFVELTDEELQRYERATEKIAKSYSRSKNDDERDKWFSLLCIKRQDIIKNAVNKFKAFRKILDELGEDIKHCLVYCSPDQIDIVQDILNEKNIVQHKFTLDEGTTPKEEFGGISEREFLLRKFAESTYQILVAIRCLDEGVDVPPARTAIVLASTDNPREWIQRRGRILRPFPGKDKATIYDIIVVPGLTGVSNQEISSLEKKIFKKELIRYKEFAGIATNSLECLNKVYKVEKELEV